MPGGRDTRIALAIFAGVFLAHFVCPVIQVWVDTFWVIPTAHSLIHDGDVYLDEFEEFLEFHDAFGTDRVGEHYVNRYPIGTPLLAVPFVAVLDPLFVKLLELCPPLEEYIQSRAQQRKAKLDLIVAHKGVQLGIACVFMAFTTALLYLVARRELPPRYAGWLAFFFAFGTGALSTGSRALWQHGPTAMLLFVVLVLVGDEENPGRARWAGIPLGFSFLVRPTNAFSILAFTAFVWFRRRESFGWFVAGMVPSGLGFLLYNHLVFGTALPYYYALAGNETYFPGADAPVVEGANDPPWLRVVSLFLSPSRGLLVYSPLFVLLPLGIRGRLRSPRDRPLALALLAAIGMLLLLLSRFVDWHGEAAFGSRYWVDMLPYLCWLMIPAFGWLAGLEGPRRKAIHGLAILLTAASCFVHLRGATSREPGLWQMNADAAGVPRPSMERAWDWGDPQWMRGLW